MNYKSEFIAFMARSGALTFGDFVTKSGRKTPYFVNTGKYSSGQQIAQLGGFYANCIMDNVKISENTVLFGPAYKGISLAVSTAIALAERGIDVGYCFNRKEAKDHGEGGSLIGYKPKDGDNIIIIEDVVTAGTAVRESMTLLRAMADVKIAALYVSVDRMERGTGEKSTLNELKSEFGINVYPIINAHDIISSFPQGDERIAKMEAYLAEYGGQDG